MTNAEKAEGYNGWTNYETWAVALWIGNEPGTYEQSQEMAREERDVAPDLDNVITGIWTAEQGARYELADRLKSWVTDDMLPDLGATLAADLMMAALSEVDWQEIAEN